MANLMVVDVVDGVEADADVGVCLISSSLIVGCGVCLDDRVLMDGSWTEEDEVKMGSNGRISSAEDGGRI